MKEAKEIIETFINMIKRETKDEKELEKLINSDFETLYHTLTNQNKRKFWASFIDKIYIKDGKVIKITFLG